MLPVYVCLKACGRHTNPSTLAANQACAVVGVADWLDAQRLSLSHATCLALVSPLALLLRRLAAAVALLCGVCLHLHMLLWQLVLAATCAAPFAPVTACAVAHCSYRPCCTCNCICQAAWAALLLLQAEEHLLYGCCRRQHAPCTAQLAAGVVGLVRAVQHARAVAVAVAVAVQAEWVGQALGALAKCQHVDPWGRGW